MLRTVVKYLYAIDKRLILVKDALQTWINKLFTTNSDDYQASIENGFDPLKPEVLRAYNQHRPDGLRPLFCYVPFSSMSFSFKGRVLACAYNQKVELGRYPQQTIHEMWFSSQEGDRLREHMRHNDLNYGCKHCKYFVEHGKFSGLKPLVFDKYHRLSRFKHPKVMEFELSNTCNFECVMCNGEVSSSIRKNRDKLPPVKSPYDDAFVEQLKEFVPHLEEAKFYGGEPFLIPIYFKIWDLMLELNPSIKIFIITNGSVLNDRIKELLYKGHFEIGVSLDSMNKERLESIRLNVQQEVLLKNIAYFNKYCREMGRKLVISFTMMRINYSDFEAAVRFCNEIDAILYVSYLKTPPKFAIWNLPSSSLVEILEGMKQIQLPSKSYAEQQNKQCLLDFITYLENCIIDNLSRPTEELIPMSNDLSPQTGLYIESFDEEEDYQLILMNILREQPALLEKVCKVTESIPAEMSLNRLFFSMCQTPKAELIKSLSELSTVELSEKVHAFLKI
jgi:MoaA/NifB/PqqE/SkfB family radical SAM enzyme